MTRYEKINNLDQVENCPDYDLIFKKFFGSRFSVKDEFNMENLNLAARNFYTSLYENEKVNSSIIESEEYPDRIDIMKQKLSVIPKIIPSEEEFTKEFVNILTKGINYENAISEEVKEQFNEVMKLSEKTIIWTEGENRGTEEYPGSKEQLYKIANTNFFNKARQKVAKEKDREKTDVLSIFVSENKKELISEIIKIFEEKQINKIILVEDRLENIIDFINKSKIEVFPVWVRQSIYKDKKVEEDKTLDEQKEKYNAIDNIGDLMDLLKKNNIFENKKVASVFDFDGVLMNDDLRRNLQVSSIIKRFQELGWI